MHNSKDSYQPAKALPTLARVALPLILAGVAWLGPQALAANDSPDADASSREGRGLGIGGKLPHSINLAELEARSAERFAELDSDNNGLIDAQEFASGARKDGKIGEKRHKRGRMHRAQHRNWDKTANEATRAEKKAELKAELFARLDQDNNGELSSDEFANRRNAQRALHQEQHLKHRFNRMDDNQDAQLSLAEFQQRLEKMRALDSDADGIVTRAELHRGMKARKAERHKHHEHAEGTPRQG